MALAIDWVNGKKHVWKKSHNNDLNYKCDCIKCNNLIF